MLLYGLQIFPLTLGIPLPFKSLINLTFSVTFKRAIKKTKKFRKADQVARYYASHNPDVIMSPTEAILFYC